MDNQTRRQIAASLRAAAEKLTASDHAEVSARHTDNPTYKIVVQGKTNTKDRLMAAAEDALVQLKTDMRKRGVGGPEIVNGYNNYYILSSIDYINRAINQLSNMTEENRTSSGWKPLNEEKRKAAISALKKLSEQFDSDTVVTVFEHSISQKPGSLDALSREMSKVIDKIEKALKNENTASLKEIVIDVKSTK